MIDNFLYIFLIPIILFVNRILKKKKIFLNYTGKNHQIYTLKNKVPLSGGLFLILFFAININYFGFDVLIFFFIFFLIGLLADLDIIKSPDFRFLFQILLLILFIVNFDLTIQDIRIDFINIFLENYYINILFVSFCLLVLINGSNFIDGNNGLAIGYYTIVFLILIKLNYSGDISFENNQIISFVVILIILLTFNVTNKLYLGDNGIYLLSIYAGFNLINLFNNYPLLSPYFIANLLWYPAFEILFSVIRKLNSKFSPMKPDTLHLHQLIFFYYTKKLKFKKNVLNTFTGLTINIYNVLIIYLSSTDIYNTKFQVSILIINILIYLLNYSYFKYLKNYF